MSDRSAAMGLAERQFRRAAAKKFGLRFRDERPGDRLDHAARRPGRDARSARAAATGSAPRRRQHPSRSSGVGVMRSRPARRMISSTRSALPSMSGRQLGARTWMWPALQGCAARAKPSSSSFAVMSLGSSATPVRRCTSDSGKSIGLGRRGDSAGDRNFRRLAAAQRQNHARRQLQARNRKLRINAALKPIARIGDNAEFSACLGDVRGVPQRGFDQNVGGGLVATGALAAHHAGERFDAVIVGDHHDILIQRIGLAVERDEAFARPWRGE